MPIIVEEIDKGIFLRCGPRCHCYGDEWQFGLLLRVDEDGAAYLWGGRGKIYPGILRDVRDKLREMGFARYRWERIKNGKTKIVEGTICQ